MYSRPDESLRFELGDHQPIPLTSRIEKGPSRTTVVLSLQEGAIVDDALVQAINDLLSVDDGCAVESE